MKFAYCLQLRDEAEDENALYENEDDSFSSSYSDSVIILNLLIILLLSNNHGQSQIPFYTVRDQVVAQCEVNQQLFFLQK